jgi:hypothetical protein
MPPEMAYEQMYCRFSAAPGTSAGQSMIATLPTQTHLAYLRTLLGRVRYSGYRPSQQEAAHALESVEALDRALKTTDTPSTNNK